jgi:hypothetical protein
MISLTLVSHKDQGPGGACASEGKEISTCHMVRERKNGSTIIAGLGV